MAEVSEVDQETMADITNYEVQGRELLDLPQGAPPREIVKIITEHVRLLKAEKRHIPKDDVLSLGILLGWQYVHGFDWHWAEVVWDSDEETSAIGVLPKDKSLFINPMWWMNDVLNTDRATNFMLNYNMVAAGNVPPSQPDDALGFH